MTRQKIRSGNAPRKADQEAVDREVVAQEVVDREAVARDASLQPPLPSQRRSGVARRTTLCAAVLCVGAVHHAALYPSCESSCV